MLDQETKEKLLEEIELIVDLDPKEVTDEDNPHSFLSKLFQKACKKYFHAIAKANCWRYFTCTNKFAEYSCFIKCGKTVIYVHTSNYYFWNWRDVVCKRAIHSEDTAGPDCKLVDIIDVEEQIIELFKQYGENLDKIKNIDNEINIE